MLNKHPIYRSSLFYACLIIFGLAILSNSEPLLMTEDVGQLIFQQHQYFIIYVYDTPTPSVLETFNAHCQQRTNCTVLNSTVPQYAEVRKFIGKRGKQFFLILNVPFEKKYILDINTKNFTAHDLAIFQQKYHEETLEPFQASQAIPKQNSEICTELVGRTFDQFLQKPGVLKVVYTYTKHEACEGCPPLLRDFKELAQKMYNEKVLLFGYIDVFLNDVEKIPEPIVPHFYIYEGDQIAKQIDEANFEELPEIIKGEVQRVMIDIQNLQISSNDNQESKSTKSQQL